MAEARCFNNPIVTTNFTGANEQINNETTGLVCDISEDGIYNSIKRLLDDEELYITIKNNLSNEVVDSTGEIAKLDKKISDLRKYDKICNQRKEHLNNTTQIIDEILSEGSGTICTANGGLPPADRRKLYYDHIFLVA